LLLVAFLLVNAPDCRLSLVLTSVVQSDAVICNKSSRLAKAFASAFLVYEHGLS